jgi:hypothetical protein
VARIHDSIIGPILQALGARLVLTEGRRAGRVAVLASHGERSLSTARYDVPDR